MITSYEVGAVLKIIDQVSPALVKLAGLAKDVDAAIIKAQESLSKFSSTRMAGLIGRIGEVNKQLDGSAGSADRAATALTAGFARVDGAIAATAANVRALQASMAQLQLPRALGGGGVGAPPGVRGRGMHGGAGPHMGLGRRPITP